MQTGGQSMVSLKKYYTRKFSEFPDIVDLKTFRKMMGGIGDSFARTLIHENRVNAIFVKPHYWISKESIIGYIVGDDYARRRLKVRP